jgi:hypothetical protein
MTSDPTVLDF